MTTQEALLHWLSLFYPDQATIEVVFNAHFSNLLNFVEAFWQLDKLLYFFVIYVNAIIPWQDYFEIIYQQDLILILIRVQFSRGHGPLLPITARTSLILYIEIDFLEHLRLFTLQCRRWNRRTLHTSTLPQPSLIHSSYSNSLTQTIHKLPLSLHLCYTTTTRPSLSPMDLPLR